MPAQFTMPPDTRAVGTGNPPADMNGVVDALTAMGTVFNICNAAFAGGADPTGASDSTAAYNAALAALPTKTIWANPNNNSGASAVVPVGTILIPAGTFKFGSLGVDAGNAGPCVNIIGAGRNATTIAYYGAGDCLRVYNPVLPASNTLDTMAVLAGRITGFIIDGKNAQAGACGLHYGDVDSGILGPDLMITNFSQGTLSSVPVLSLGTTNGSGGTFAAGSYFWVVSAINRSGETIASNLVTATLALNGTQGLSWTSVSGATGYRVYRGPGTSGQVNTYVTQLGAVTSYTDTGTSLYVSCPPRVNTTGNIGLHMDNTVSWTESIWGRVVLMNCGNAVVVTGSNPGPDASFEYNDLSFEFFATGPGQNGIVLRNGAYWNNGSLKLRANFVNSSSAMSSAALVLAGAYQGAYSQIQNTRLDIQTETNTPLTGGGANTPMTISFSDPNHNPIQGCTGILSFFPFGGAWTSSNYGSATFRTTFSFEGIVQGDTALSPASGPYPTAIGTRTLSSGFAVSTFQPLSSGEAFALTLAGNTTLVLAGASTPCIAGPQRKTFAITQAAAGGPYTVTWPSPGSPTLSNPTVIWPGGAAPVQSAAANAVDIYTLTTIDGIRWYGSVSQASASLGPDRLGLAPSGATGETFPRELGSGGYLAGLTSGTVYVSAIELGAGIPVNNLTLTVGSTGFTTVTHGWYALLDSGRVVRAVTADQTGGNWGTTFAAVTLSVAASAYTTTYSGLYYVAFCATFAGSGSFPTIPAVNGGITSNAPFLQGTSSTGQTTPPVTGTTMGAITAVAANRFYAYTS